MVDACEASGTKLVISHQRRFTKGWERAREMVQEGVIGEKIYYEARVMCQDDIFIAQHCILKSGY